MADPIHLPVAVLRPQSISFSLAYRSTSGGPNVQGDEQVVESGASRWRAQLAFKLMRQEQVLAYRAVLWQARGRSRTWLVPTCSGFQKMGTPVGGVFPAVGVPTIVNVPFSDSAPFGDTGEFETKMVMAAVTVGAAARANSITIQMNDTSQIPIAGVYFSIGQSLYGIETAIPTVDGNLSGPYVITFSPGLRVAANAGDVVDFSRPACLMRLSSDDTGKLDLDLLRFGSPTLEFVEAPLGS